MPRLLVFNPEHDYALAHDTDNYMAPGSIKKLAEELRWLPLCWSMEDDFILMPENSMVKASDGETAVEDFHRFDFISPWGWDKALMSRLSKLGCPRHLLPSRNDIEILRRLSHRRISIACNAFLEAPAVPEEFTNIGDAMSFYKRNPGCYFKMPWSSGGRGVVDTSELNETQVKEWVSGSIRRQKSVMGEKRVDRVLDFASLWHTEGGKAVYEGFSISISDGRGKYDGNYYGPQSRMEEIISKASPLWKSEILLRQKLFLEKEIAPYYTGKLGIDMMVAKDGAIFPCAEINLRRTMGHVAMDYYNMELNGENSDSRKGKCSFSFLHRIQED